MIATILKGKDLGMEIEISQWSNDWFLAPNGDVFSPNDLGFSIEDMGTITECVDNGSLFKQFRSVFINIKHQRGKYVMTFKPK